MKPRKSHTRSQRVEVYKKIIIKEPKAEITAKHVGNTKMRYPARADHERRGKNCRHSSQKKKPLPQILDNSAFSWSIFNACV